jgi:tetratricopeptide (TPR) repeat protein
VRLPDLIGEVEAGVLSIEKALQEAPESVWGLERDAEEPSTKDLLDAFQSILHAVTAKTAIARARIVAAAGEYLLIDGVSELACAVTLNRLRDSRAHAWAELALSRLPASSGFIFHARRTLSEASRQQLGAVDDETASRVAEELNELIGTSRTAENPGALAMALLERALFEDGRGMADEAFTTISEAVQVRMEAPAEVELFVDDLESFWGTKGEIARHAERWDEAISAYEEARAAALTRGQPRTAAYHLSNIGFTWQEAGEYERGEAILKEASSEADAAGASGLAQFWRGERFTDQRLVLAATEASVLRRALILMKSTPPEVDEAIVDLRTFLRAHRGRSSLLEQAHARNLLAMAFSAKDEPQQALASALRAADLAGRAGALRFEAEYRTNAALQLASTDRYREAEIQVRIAVDVGERALAEQQSSELRQAVSGGLARAYEFLAFMAATHYKPSPPRWGCANPENSDSPPDPPALFDIGDRLRGLNLLRLLHLSVAVDHAKDAVLTDAFAKLRAVDVAVEAAAIETHQPLRDLLRKRALLATAFEVTAREHGISTTEVLRPGLNAVLAQLPPDAVLVDVLSLSEGVAYLAASPRGPVVVDLLPWHREKRTATVNSFLRSCGRQAVYDLPAAVADSDDPYPRTAAELDDLLFMPIRDAMANWDFRHVFVVPHRELFTLPWARLAGGLPVTVLPTASALQPLRARDRRRSGRWVAVGDPTTSLAQNEKELSSLRNAERISPRRDSLMKELRDAVRLHLACHGRFDVHNPYRSGLSVLGPGDRISVQDIIGELALPRCWLVFLGACNSALARVHPSNEFTSLPGAFLIAGARNVVASLWPAHDGAARLLAEEFYRCLDGPNQPGVAKALALAKAAVADLSRQEVVARLGDERFVPLRDPPFSRDLYLDTFQHYGVD